MFLNLSLDHISLISRVSEPETGASYKNRRPRNPETLCRYIIARVNESIYFLITLGTLLEKQGRKRPLDTPKRMIKRREREGEREKER